VCHLFHFLVWSLTLEIGAGIVPGHKSELAFGFLSGVPAVAMLGRVCSESNPPQPTSNCSSLVSPLRRSFIPSGGLPDKSYGTIGSQGYH
jgi:hypothetical protein